jgi:hypothetical protein
LRILIATSFHEHLPALTGFHLNWRAALSGRMSTIAHLSATTRAAMLMEAAEEGVLPSAEGLVINPISIPTRFGSALPMLIHNRLTAGRLGLEATHLCLASPYLYAFEAGLDRVIEAADCGLPAVTYALHAHWLWHEYARADPRLAALARHLNVEITLGRADGVFLPVALFDDMLALLHRFFTPAELAQPEPLYPLEEILFPTVLPALLGPGARIVPARARVWENDDPPNTAKIAAAIGSGLYASGKRIAQLRGDPARNAVLANLPGPAVIATHFGGAPG